MEHLKMIGKFILIELSLVILGYILLVIAYCIPVNDMNKHVKESLKIFEEEGTYPQLITGYRDSQLDNWTDALMLLTAIYEDNENNVFKQAAINTRTIITGKNPSEVLIAMYCNNGDELGAYNYGRYWHGYLVLLKPLLVFFNYGEIKYLNMIFQFVLVLIVIHLFSVKNKAHYGIPFCFYVLSLNPVTVALSMQFSGIYILTLISIIVLLFKEEHYKENNELVIAHFLIVGCLTSYFDLLTYPLHTLAIPMILWLAISKHSRYGTAIKLGIAWIFGYGGMWSGKWFLGSLITGNNVLRDALNQAAIRTSKEVYDTHFAYFDIIKRTFSTLNKQILFVALAVSLIYILICICKHKAKLDVKFVVLLIMIAVIPFGWYFVMGNHSYQHFWFTFRELSICIFAIQMIAVSSNKEYQ